MRSSRPPAVATWLLEHLRAGSQNDYITGDLMEAYRCGRSRAWYWKQVLASIIVSFCQEIMAHPVLAVRAITMGWAICLLYDYGVGKMVVWLVMVIVRHDQSLGAAYVDRIVGGVCSKWLDRSPAKSSPSDRNGDGICRICIIIRPSSDSLDLVPWREHADRQPVSSLLAKRSGKFDAAARGHIARRTVGRRSRERIGMPRATFYNLESRFKASHLGDLY